MFRFCLPESFHPGEFLPPKLIRLADDARFFVATILTKTARKDVDEFRTVRLMAKHLRNIMNFRHYNDVIDSLLIGGAVQRVAYEVGNCPFGYRLAERFRNDRHVRIQATDGRLIRRLTAFHQAAENNRQSRLLPVHHALERHQRYLEIDGDQAREILETLPPESNPYDVQGVLVQDIKDREFHINVGTYGRLINNVTSLKREVRQALRLGMEPLEHVDIRCCQPALIGQMIRAKTGQQQQGRTGRQTGTAGGSNYDVQFCQSLYTTTAKNSHCSGSDVDVYCALTQSGEFYDFLLAKLKSQSCSTFSRDDLKKRFLCDVVAKRKANSQGDEYPSPVEDVFSESFPSVYQFIREFNADGWHHENLIRRLQQEESRLVIETVAADLVVSHPGVFLLTLHDAIFTTPRYIPDVIGAFERAFLRTGFAMALKVAR